MGSALRAPQYRQKNTAGAGNSGQNTLNILHCRGIAVGNGSFYSNVNVAYYAVYVAAPEDRAGPDSDYYLLDALTDNADVALQIAVKGLPIAQAKFTATGNGYQLTAPTFSAALAEQAAIDQPDNGTFHSRLHWVNGSDGCWVDFDEVALVKNETAATLEGQAGHPSALAGPLVHAAGLGIVGTEDARMTAPVCQALT